MPFASDLELYDMAVDILKLRLNAAGFEWIPHDYDQDFVFTIGHEVRSSIKRCLDDFTLDVGRFPIVETKLSRDPLEIHGLINEMYEVGMERGLNYASSPEVIHPPYIKLTFFLIYWACEMAEEFIDSPNRDSALDSITIALSSSLKQLNNSLELNGGWERFAEYCDNMVSLDE